MMYIGIKKVVVEPMNADEAVKKGYRTNGNKGDGYEVMYEDGYKSWCPKNVFHQYNFEVNNEQLADTCKMMVSPDYKERFKAEFYQLENRFKNLKKMVERWDAGKLEFKPTCSRYIYEKQLAAMESYIEILDMRAQMEGVEL